MKTEMKYLPTNKIEESANQLLEKFQAFDIPVKVDKIAFLLGLEVDFVSLGEDVSGLLLVENGKGFIGINSSHPSVRQRFTIAHEIGHYVLHGQEENLFIDKKYNAFRNTNSATGVDRAEIQANMFAASLLMPQILLEKHIKSKGFDLGDGSVLSEIAKDFEVSVEALAYRLAKIDAFQSESSDDI